MPTKLRCWDLASLSTGGLGSRVEDPTGTTHSHRTCDTQAFLILSLNLYFSVHGGAFPILHSMVCLYIHPSSPRIQHRALPSSGTWSNLSYNCFYFL